MIKSAITEYSFSKIFAFSLGDGWKTSLLLMSAFSSYIYPLSGFQFLVWFFQF